VNRRANSLVELQVRLMLMTVEKDGETPRRIYRELNVEREGVLFLPLTWTIVHPIDGDSPLWGVDPDEMKRRETEVLILIKGFDDTFNQTVLARRSYRYDHIEWGKRFAPAFFVDGQGDLVLEMPKVGELV